MGDWSEDVQLGQEAAAGASWFSENASIRPTQDMTLNPLTLIYKIYHDAS